MNDYIFDSPTLETLPEDMSDRELLLELYTSTKEIHEFMSVLKLNYDKIVSTIEIDSKTLRDLFDMSHRTLSRWRADKKIRYYVRQDGFYYYKFNELYVDVKSGRLDGRGFNRMATLARMKAYYHGVMKTYNNIVELGDKIAWKD